MDDFKYLLNKESNKKCLILGGAPSIDDIQFEKFNGILISMGDIPERIAERRQIDYWVAANSIFPRPDKHYDLLNKFKGTTFVFSNSALNSTVSLDYQKINQHLRIPWFEYDQRHFNGLDCNKQIDYQVNPGLDLEEPLNCCQYKKAITIQEYLRNIYNLDSHYSSGSTVAIHSLALAIILGCKEIYLAGIELPKYEKDYTHYGSNSTFKLIRIFFKEIVKGDRTIPLKNVLSVILKGRTKSSFYPDLPAILKDFEYLSNLCKSNGIKLFNLSSTSSLNKIHNLKLLDPSMFNKL